MWCPRRSSCSGSPITDSVSARKRARDAGLSIGLYLDVAVGVRPDGLMLGAIRVPWCPTSQSVHRPIRSIRANRIGDPFNPLALPAGKFATFRHVLQAAMRYAGAIRLDHVLGLRRLYLVPNGSPKGASIGLANRCSQSSPKREFPLHACAVGNLVVSGHAVRAC